jgi:probable non-F420 flavinoid oxidoreductase
LLDAIAGPVPVFINSHAIVIMKIGYHASHEQYSPRDLLDYVVRAAQAGFQHVQCSDHFYPWSIEQGQSGFAWSWLGAAMQAAPAMSFGIVNAPGQRYHPAIIAQASASLAEMFPDRFWIALGSGQYVNEHITGTGWPEKSVRNQRLKECANLMRAMWNGLTVTTDGLIRTEHARLYTLPANAPMLFGAALSEEKAAFIAPWADGMITISDKPERVKKIIEAFREHGGTGPVHLKVQLSFGADYDDARRAAYLQWRNNCLDKKLQEDLRTPEEFDAVGNTILPSDVEDKVLISTSPQEFIEWFKEFESLGVDTLFLHNVNRNQAEFLEAFGKHVLPKFKS